MICRTCNQENEFYQGQSICKECYVQRYKDKYKLKEKKMEYPKARCENCDNLFQTACKYYMGSLNKNFEALCKAIKTIKWNGKKGSDFIK